MKKIVLSTVCLVIAVCAKSQETFTDDRDGEVYKTVTIDGTTWLAENLRHETKTGSESWKVIDGHNQWGSPTWAQDASKDATHGRYYAYEIATEACPAGWDLPTESDFMKLSEKFGGDEVSGRSLKSKEGWAWKTNGDNSSGMNIKAYGSIYKGNSAGFHDGDLNLMEEAKFWVKGKVKDGKAPYRFFTSRDGGYSEVPYKFQKQVFTAANAKMTIRCVQK